MSSYLFKHKPSRLRRLKSRSTEPIASLALTRQKSLLRVRRQYLLLAFALWFLLAAPVMSGIVAADEKHRLDTVTVDLTVGKPVTFLPDEAFGRAIDGLSQGEVDRVYTRQNIDKIETSGLHRVSYRLRTELGIEAWHWSEEGAWSDPTREQGYWTSSDAPKRPILVSHGYKLPRRGNTTDQANDNGFSRIDDGDPTTFWKTNPYLDAHYIGAEAVRFPQWLIIDLGATRAVDAARIIWGEPYAKRFDVQYWDGPAGSLTDISTANWLTKGRWRTFPQGESADGHGGDAMVRLSPSTVEVRFVRILMIESSGTAFAGSTDLRDRLGFSVREIYVGAVDAGGAFHDFVKHATRSDRQTVIYTSSTDPWHRSADRDLDTEQPGLDRVFQSGMAGKLPVMMPVGVLYDTPENAAAEIRFLRSRGYPVSQIEMGEEPDGQLVSPEHYAALFLEFASALHGVDPSLALGAAGFQEGLINTWPDDTGNTSWLSRFVKYLDRSRRLSDLGFFSFERYPFEDLCQPAADQLKLEPRLMEELFARLRDDGVPPSIPWMLTEYGYSAFAGRTMVEIPSALLNADMVGHFLTLGGRATYLYGSEPQTPMNEGKPCAGYGNMMLFEADDAGKASWPMPTFYGAQLITQEWAQPVNEPHRLYPAESDIRDDNASAIVTAYAVYRPDGKWSLMLINKDPNHVHSISIKFTERIGAAFSGLTGKVDIFQYGPEQYHWTIAGEHGHPNLSDPPHHRVQEDDQPVDLPAFSLTVVRGSGPRPP